MSWEAQGGGCSLLSSRLLTSVPQGCAGGSPALKSFHSKTQHPELPGEAVEEALGSLPDSLMGQTLPLPGPQFSPL